MCLNLLRDEILDAIPLACMCFNFGHQFSKKFLKNHLNYNLLKKENCLNYENYVLLIFNKNFLDTIVPVTITRLKLPWRRFGG